MKVIEKEKQRGNSSTYKKGNTWVTPNFFYCISNICYVVPCQKPVTKKNHNSSTIILAFLIPSLSKIITYGPPIYSPPRYPWHIYWQFHPHPGFEFTLVNTKNGKQLASLPLSMAPLWKISSSSSSYWKFHHQPGSESTHVNTSNGTPLASLPLSMAPQSTISSSPSRVWICRIHPGQRNPA